MPRPPPRSLLAPSWAEYGLSCTGELPGSISAQMSSARRTAGAFRRDTGTISFVPSSMTREQLALRPRSTSRTRLEVDHVPAVHPQEPGVGQLAVELVQARGGGAQPPLIGGQPHVVPLRLGEADLRQPQQHHPVVARRDHPPRVRPRVRGPLPWGNCDPLGGAERDQVPDQVTGEEDGPDADRRRLVGEVGEDLRRADPVGVAGRLPAGVPGGTDQLRQPGFQRTVGSSAGVEAGTPMSTLAVSSVITTLPAVSIAAIATPERARASV